MVAASDCRPSGTLGLKLSKIGRKDAYQDEHDYYAFGEDEGQDYYKSSADVARDADFIHLLVSPRRS